MREQEVRELYEAYMQVHQPQEEVEQLDEFLGSGAAKVVDKATKAVQTGLGKLGMPINRTPRGPVTGPQQKKKIEGNVKEDLFDVIKCHLIDEGFADTNEAALAIMANMSEEWKQSIMEGPGGMMMSAASQGRGQIVKTRREPGPRPSQSGSAMGRKPVDRSRLQPPVGATVTRYDSGGKPYTHIQK
jgi:hypothetical protein